MASLLTTGQREPDISWIRDFVSRAAQMAAERDARDRNAAQELVRGMEQRRQFNIKADFDAQQQERAARQFDSKMAFDREREAADLLREKGDQEYKAGRDLILDNRYKAENAPFEPLPPLPDSVESVPQNADASFIKLSNYGYGSDTTPDTNSMNGIGHSNNKLEDGVSAALSKSLATRLGVKTGDWLNIETTKGPMRVRYDDTVPASDSRVEGPLPETIDIFRRNGANDWGGKVTGISTERKGEQSIAQQMRASEQLLRGVPKKEANAAKANMAEQLVRGSTRSTTTGPRSETLGNGDRVIYDRNGNIEAIVGSDNVARRLPSAAPEIRDIGNGQVQIGTKIASPDESGRLVGNDIQANIAARQKATEAKIKEIKERAENDAAAKEELRKTNDESGRRKVVEKFSLGLAQKDFSTEASRVDAIDRELAEFRKNNPKFNDPESRPGKAFAEIQGRRNEATAKEIAAREVLREIQGRIGEKAPAATPADAGTWRVSPRDPSIEINDTTKQARRKQ